MATPFKHFSIGTIRLLAGLALVLVVAFFALTRTELGRQAVATQLEAQFARSTQATLSIGELTGNLAQRFTARDVVIRDSRGQLLLKADTVIFRPSWEDLLRRRFDSRRVELRQPELYLPEWTPSSSEDDASGSIGEVPSRWGGWRDLLPAQSDSSSAAATPWTFRSLRLIVRNGSLVRRPAPDSTLLVGQALNLDARLERLADGLQGDLLSASVRGLVPNLEVLRASGQFIADSSTTWVNGAQVETANSRIAFDGRLGRGSDPEFAVDVPRSRISFQEVSGLFPWIPLSGVADLEVAASGRLSDFVVSLLKVDSGTSSVVLSGTVLGWPSTASVDLGLRLQPLRSADLRAIYPGIPIPGRVVIDSLRGRVDVLGTINRTSGGGGLDLEVDLDGSAGRAAFSGRLGLAGTSPRSLTGSLRLAGFEPGAAYLTGLSGGRLNAEMDVAIQTPPRLGRVPALHDVMGRLEGRVFLSSVGRIQIEEASVAATRTADGADLEVLLTQNGSTSRARLQWPRSLSGPEPVTGQFEVQELDLGALLGMAGLRTAITAQASGEMLTASPLAGTISIQTDSSQVVRGLWTSRPPPQRLDLTLTPTENGSRLSLSGSQLSGALLLDGRQDALLKTARFWTAAFENVVGRQADKPYRRASGASAPAPDLTSFVRREQASASLGGGSVRVEGRIVLNDLATLASWVPRSQPLTGASTLTIDWSGNEDGVSGSMVVESEAATWADWKLWGSTVSVSGSTSFSEAVEDSLELRLRASADSLSGAIATIPAPALSFDFSRLAGTITFSGDRGSLVGPLALTAGLQLDENRLRMRLDTVRVAARQLGWTVKPGALVDVYSDAVSIDNLILTEGANNQSIRVQGTLSPAPGDTLRTQVRAFQLGDLTRFGQWTRQLDGVLTADIALTGGFQRPRIDSRVRVPAFVLDDRLLGDLALSTSILPESEGIGINLTLKPSRLPAMGVSYSEVVDNRVTARGSVRLPADADPGNWRIQAEFERADLFFLKYVFNESVDRFQGYARASATVSGPFGRPIVDATAVIRDGTFGVPRIGVRYQVEGEARIDQEAIHLDRVTLIDHDGGSVDVSGPLLFNDYRFFSFDLTGDLNELLVMNRGETLDLPFYGSIRGSGRARLTGPLPNATLRIADGRTRADSELFLPIVDTAEEGDESFIIFADSTGRIPNLERLIRRPFFLARRASSERQFLDGLDMDLNIAAPRGSLIHLVIDPLLGDVINAQSTGVVQIRRNQGEFSVFGQMEVEGGDYLFTAGEVFVRRFIIQPGGLISWVGDPVNATLNISAAYRTRASTAGLNDVNLGGALIPLIVDLRITGQVSSPAVDLGLSIDRSNQNALGNYQGLEARLNQPDRATEYATSVLLTNSFQLTTNSIGAGAGEQLAFNSVSQLVSSQLSRFLDAAIPNVDFSFGLQGERAEDLDITYGVALRLLDERLIIRGEGVYQGSNTDNTRANTQGIQGEFVVEVKLSPSVSAQVFFRREGDILQNADLTNTAGAGLTYQTDFPSWKRALRRLLRIGR